MNIINKKVHPVMTELMQSGCNDQHKVAVAFQVYLELSEVEKLWNIEYSYNRDLDIFYFKGNKSSSSEEQEIFIPLSITTDISPGWIEKVQNQLCINSSEKCITLAVKEQDSTVVYYTVHQALIPPDSPDTTRRKKQKQEARNVIRSELHRQQEEIYQTALE